MILGGEARDARQPPPVRSGVGGGGARWIGRRDAGEANQKAEGQCRNARPRRFVSTSFDLCLVFGWDGWWSVWWWWCVPCWLFVFLPDGPSVGSSRRGCIAAQQRLPCDGGVWRAWFPQPLLVRDAASPAFLSLRQVWVVYCCPLAPTRDVRARILPVARHLRRYVCSSRQGRRTTDTETAQAMD